MNALSPDTIDQLGLRQARQSRDPRFDGRFFVAITSTGIYCRPICPAPMPKEANVQYYDSAIAAANAGYRPCLRCRPDSAPGSKAWQGNRTTLERAVGLIDEGALVDNSVSALAERLGITTRYLNKLFQQHLGTNAKQYALYQQLMLAKRLLHETDLAMAEVAYAAGFGSVRRFNDVFATMLKLTPGQIRRGGRRDDGGNCASTATGLNLFLSYRPPYDWARLQAFLASRAIPGLEWVDEDSYGRTLTVDGVQARFTAVHRPQRNGFDVELEMATSRPLMGVVRTVRRILDLDADSREIDQHLAALPGFDPLPGLRLPGLPAPFEAGCRAILGQQITVTAARKLVTTLVGEYGTGSGPDGPCWFPSPQAVAQGSLQELGMPQSRRDTLRRFAEHMTEPDRSQDTNFDDWLGHKGIGPWTVNYARMRALGDGDIWLAGDAGIKNALKILGVSLAPEQAAPWRSYLTLQFWNSLKPSGKNMKFESRLDTPLGPLAILANNEAIEAVTFDVDETVRPANAISEAGLRQLTEYFAGEREQFDLPLAPQGTAFRQQAWQALQAIPYGETRFYGQQAELMGNPKAVRAVGAANGANPIAIVIPCHRVIGKDGSLTGYAGGLDKKAWLLAFERQCRDNG